MVTIDISRGMTPNWHKGEPLIQVTTNRHGCFYSPPNGWPWIKLPGPGRYGNQNHVWAIFIRLPGDRVLSIYGNPVPRYRRANR